MNFITILIPTNNRPASLAVLLTSLYGQTYKSFSIIIADQSNYNIFEHAFLRTIISIIKQKNNITILKQRPKNGIAEQRNFLLKQVQSPLCLYLDDDLVLEPYVLKTMQKVLMQEKCGFVGMAPIGLSYVDDVRINEQNIEYWKTKVNPENIVPNSKKWKRYKVHNAANIYHIQKMQNIHFLSPKVYKIAWVGGCVLYNTKALKSVGGFSFWNELPKKHCGEDVLAQINVMKKFGGCGVLPSGVYHQETPTTIVNRQINAPEFLLENQPIQQEAAISPLLPNALYSV